MHPPDFTSGRRRFLLSSAAAIPAFVLPAHAADPAVPQSVAELWADFDPLKDPLESEVIREWSEDGAILRHVCYLIGTFKGTKAFMSAVYGFPHQAQGLLPAVMHIHGGGQRGSVAEVRLLVSRGYAALSVNWGGSGTGKPPFNSCEKALPGDPNTDWGAVDPTQLNVPGYASILPGPKQLFEDREHPKNNNWYLLALGCRRGLTFLAQQPGVDSARLGVHGYSMGGNLTMYVAGTDSRVKAAVPAVGGQGWRWQPHVFGGVKSDPQDAVKGDVELFRKTLSFESYAPRIACPVLHRSGTNDFHGWMDDVYRTNALIPQPTRYSWAPHLNHRLTPAVAVTMPLWFDHHLKGGPPLPATPQSQLLLTPAPALQVQPAAHPWPVARCEIFYSIDDDPRARFWRSADVTPQPGGGFTARLPLHARESALHAFANVYFTLPQPVSLSVLGGYGTPVTEVCISTLLHTRSAEELQKSQVPLTAQPTRLIDDFSHGLRDWYVLNQGNTSHQQMWTRKVTDPLWRGPAGARLAITLRMPKTNRMAFVVEENEWRSYRGPRKTYVCRREITGSAEPQTLALELRDFTSRDGSSPQSWAQIDQLGLCARHTLPGDTDTTPAPWAGSAPEFVRVEWA
ncbi:alpha/beta hydrolase family protein [Prosthecobacter fluviatilis]|uniref:Alpha/beta hydrolase family protein n=1 Tax=Prosthecobacter fluviatilis TaxID=445931 RepID=A0ABW0KTS1_9BACT